MLSRGQALLSGFPCGPLAQWSAVDGARLSPHGRTASGQAAMRSPEPGAASWGGGSRKQELVDSWGVFGGQRGLLMGRPPWLPSSSQPLQGPLGLGMCGDWMLPVPGHEAWYHLRAGSLRLPAVLRLTSAHAPCPAWPVFRMLLGLPAGRALGGSCQG